MLVERRKDTMGLSEKLIERAKEYAFMQQDWLVHHNFMDTRECVFIQYRGKLISDPWMDEKCEKPVDPFAYYGEKKTTDFIWEILWKRDFIYEYDKREDCSRTNCKGCEYTKKCSRYSLGIKGDNPLICIGVNPSTASPEQLDPTVKTVQRYLQTDDRFDGFIMLNLYPQRATDPEDMDKSLNQEIVSRNMEYIEGILKQYPEATIWAAWGSLITKRDYLCKNLQDIVALTENHKWVCRGSISKAGHPHHPLYVSDACRFVPFDVAEYLKGFKYE